METYKATFMRLGHTQMYRLTSTVNITYVPAQVNGGHVELQPGDVIAAEQLKKTVNELREWINPQWEITLIEFSNSEKI